MLEVKTLYLVREMNNSKILRIMVFFFGTLTKPQKVSNSYPILSKKIQMAKLGFKVCGWAESVKN